MSKQVREHNRRTKEELSKQQSYYSQVNQRNKRIAQRQANDMALELFERWLKFYGDCDIIVKPNSVKKRDIPVSGRIKIADFNVDGEEITGEAEYKTTEVYEKARTVTTGGGVYGYSVNSTSDGYSVSPNYSATDTETEYDVDYSDGYAVAYGTITAKAVRGGSIDRVLALEGRLAEHFGEYTRAKQYRRKPSSILPNGGGKTTAYNVLCVLQALLTIACVVLFGGAFPQAKDFWLESLFLEWTPALPVNGLLLLTMFIVLNGLCLLSMGLLYRKLSLKADAKRFLTACISAGILLGCFIFCLLYEYVPFLRGLIGVVLVVGINIKLASLVLSAVWLLVSMVMLYVNPDYKRTKALRRQITAFLDSETYRECCRLEEEIHSYTVERETDIYGDGYD